MITLGRGSLELDIAPEMGACIVGFTYEGRPVLRPVPRGTANVLDTDMFPLVPYANRIEHGILNFGGKQYRLPLNFGDHPHSLHGDGWQNPWRVDALSRDRAALTYEHAAGGWPWSYSAAEAFSMTEDGITVQLSLTNRSDSPMPYSLGLHPYFPRVPGSTITASIDAMWASDPTQIPTQKVAATTLIDLGKTQAVGKAPFVDNTFTGWKGPARITQPELGFQVELSASENAKFFHVFIPEGTDFFCCEPTTAMPNAFGRPESASETGMNVLAPGATAHMEMHLAIRRL